VDFWASWCGPCRMIGPVFEELSGQYAGKVKFVKVNVDENPKTPATYGVRGIPTLIMFKEGKIVEQVVGAVPKAQLESLVKKVL
ncbi:MAG TPA: thioredoxin, partial [Thermodesulfobacteriota bacterium]|nr:thioredoxin [Thermodesulfobacteriota bacterium]